MTDAKEAKCEAKEEQTEDLSRMAATYGAGVITLLKRMNVFIYGLRGLGIEVAKDLILAGPKSVTVQDENKTEIADLGANFYLTEKDVGKPRAAAVLPKLGELNPNVTVSMHQGKTVDEKFISQFQVVCVCDFLPLADLLALNKICHTKNIKFIYAFIPGAMGFVFTDFAEHKITDPDGVLEKSVIIDNITNAEHGVVTIDGDRHLLDDGMFVKIENVIGMDGAESKTTPADAIFHHKDVVKRINAICELKCVPKRPNKFTIGDTRQLGAYVKGGVATQVKMPQIKHYISLEENIHAPKFDAGYVDFQKTFAGRNEQLHFAMLALWEFEKTRHALPRLHSAEDAKEIVTLAKAQLEAHKKMNTAKANSAMVVESIDEKLMTQVALYARTELTAIAALYGGVVAQEIVKYAGKYTPITQELILDAFELLFDEVPRDAQPKGTRYDHQIAVFGLSNQEKIMKQKLFLVGCGALGCEYMKGIAMTGLGCGKNGEVHITDMDTIELSNLSRQFLFRRKDVNHPKSQTAGEAAVAMNPELKQSLRINNIKVEPKTENQFTDKFWDSLDFVVNALDNIHARKYTDSKCVLHQKPLFESGTLGTQANTVIVLPHQTPSYAQGVEAGETQGIAKCTLQNFPSMPLHCIEWAREMFDDNFAAPARQFNDFLEDRERWFKKNAQDPLAELDGLKQVKKWVALCAKPTKETCVQIAFEDFMARYRDAIKDLTHAFPETARNIDPETKADMGPFWHGHKIFPRAAAFDVKDPAHIDYLFHAANLYAHSFGGMHALDEKHNRLTYITKEEVARYASECKAAPWQPTGKAIVVEEKKEEKKAAAVADDDRVQIDQLKKELAAVDLKHFRKMTAHDFEKDDDTNHHIAWITAATNMRAWNYFLKDSSFLECRMTAGRIIPAIATTTATITGFVMLEIYKHIMERKYNDHRGVTLDLAVNTYVVGLLDDPKKTVGDKKETFTIPETGFSVWDFVVVDEKKDLTFEEFAKVLPARYHGVRPTHLFKAGVSQQGQYLFQDFNPHAGMFRMAQQMLKNPSLGAENRARFEKTVEEYYKAEKLLQNKTRKISEVYQEMFGAFPTQERNYVLLEGIFKVKDDPADPDSGEHTVLIPVIKYIFKH